MDELVNHPMYLFCRAMLSRLASASNRAFSFASLSLRTSTRLHTSVISGLAWNAYDKPFRIIKNNHKTIVASLCHNRFAIAFLEGAD